MDTVHCILVCVMCPPGQGCRSWYVMSNQKFNVPELVRLHERSTGHENSSITARWILEVSHYGLGTLLDFFPPRWLNHLMAAGLVLDRLGPTLGYFILQATYGLLDGFIGKGPDTILHTFSHYIIYYSFVGRERAVKKYQFWFYARFHQHNQLLKSPASRFSFFRPILWIFWSYCRLSYVNANPSHYHQPHIFPCSRADWIVSYSN